MKGQGLINNFFKPIVVSEKTIKLEFEQQTKKIKTCETPLDLIKNDKTADNVDFKQMKELESNISRCEKNIIEYECVKNSNLYNPPPPREDKKNDIGLSEEAIELMCKKIPLVNKHIGSAWFQVLLSYFKKEAFMQLNDFVMARYKNSTVFPPLEKVWNWTQCSPKDTKVVVIGQDPYHNIHQANGLCFSVPPGVQIPPSLSNIYKELANDIEGFVAPTHGDLTGWVNQGVLLLNSVLTVEKNSPNSHKDKGWEELTTEVIKYINNTNEGVIFLLWGQYAQKKASFVNQKKHRILKAPHPSPFSFHKGFFGCKHFSKCNQLLEELGKSPIDWKTLPAK